MLTAFLIGFACGIIADFFYNIWKLYWEEHDRKEISRLLVKQIREGR